MSELVGVLYTSHGPFTDLAPERWSERKRHYRADVVVETADERAAKAERAAAALGVLRKKVEDLRPDALVIFGNDQLECFTFANFPALSIFLGDEFFGAPTYGARGHPELYRTVPGHAGLSTHLLVSLLKGGFDPSFSLEVPQPEHGMCHAVMRPIEFFEAFEIPTVPILFNAYYAPQLPALRCYQIGKAVRQAIDAYPENLRVVVIGSGGLWHTPGKENAYLNEEFDRACLGYLEKGAIRDLAEYFDAYSVPEGDTSQQFAPGELGVSGLPGIGGPQLGTRETCNWIGAAAVVDGRPTTVVDYVPMYASPIGSAFAYCDNP